MKITLLLLVALPLLVLSTPIDSSSNASVEDIDRSDGTRAKRSGLSLVSGLKSDDSHFDGWGLKKSILNTLFQAVKAITGGVTILKGQLIKGSGYAVSGVGKLIAAGGDSVSNVGKKITTSAHLVPASHSAAVHPFAKLSGALSSGSAGLISGASSSSSGKSSSSGHHTGPSSESFTSYDAPSNYGHDSHSHVSAPSSAAYIPPKQTIHYKSPLTSYGTEIEAYPSAPHYLPPSKANVVEASDVLRQILNKKAPQLGHSYSSYQQSTGPVKYEKKIVTQHAIPAESYPPPFKPLNTNNYLPPLYGIPHGPVESVTHSQSITTSFGAPYNSPHVEEVEQPQYPPSYDIYHSMSVKMAGKNEKLVHQSHSNYPDPRSKKPYGSASTHPHTHSVSPYLSPPKPTALTYDQKHLQHVDDEEIHQQQLHDLSSKYGPAIEVQKSLTYELSDQVDVSNLAASIHDLSRRRSDNSKQLKRSDKPSDSSNGDRDPKTATTKT
ncbi:uncharacterized protein LOC134205525 isoform X2 [Armigeres subalbatus]|uniref:uncharacterized protein LOC134205525 isoform X2 n=1 Tax=Armigeres subalbatus TaxID=124917 RepID=UPI002ED641EC